MSQCARDGELTSQTVTNEIAAILPEARHTHVLEDTPCPVCGVVCPNEMYCINCGYIHDPIMKKYQTPEQIEAEKKRQKEFRIIEKRKKAVSKSKRRQSKHHAMMVRIGREFKRQNGKAAEPGDIVRRKKLDGSYDKGAFWYIRTPNGWRKSPSKKRKPTKSQIKRVYQD